MERLVLLGALYFSQGLPFGFFTQALPVLLRQHGWSLTAIGLATLLSAPWALKFLWAPLVDRTGWERIGRRRSWILPLQGATAATLLVVGAFAGADALRALLAAALLLNLLAATQDIATDGLAVEILDPEQRGLANGLQVAAYRVGMFIGGGALLMLQPRLGWSATFATMALLLAAATAPVLLVREPHARPPAPTAGRALHFARLPGAPRVLALAFVYKFGEHFASGMLRSFLVDAGLGLADIGFLVGTVGFTAGLVGALTGGALVNVLGRRPALVAFGVLQTLAVATYALAALHPGHRPLLTAIVAVEHFAGGTATAALFTSMMDWSRRHAAGADYTVQASTVVIATGIATALSGLSADALGYHHHFLAATAVSLGAPVAAVALYPRAAPGDTA